MLERIYLLSKRLISRLLVKSVKEESKQVSAVRLERVAQGAERLGITHVRVKKILEILLNLLYQYLNISI